MLKSRGAYLIAAALVALTIVAVTMAGPRPAHAAFPGANGKIAFEHGSRYEDANGNIYTVSPSGDNLERLTFDSPRRQYPAINILPSWSANGKKIVFSRYNGGNFGQFDIYTMNADGSNRTRVIDERSIPGRATNDLYGTVSPRGRQIVFTRGDSNFFYAGDGLYKIDTDGSNLNRITKGIGGPFVAPVWSSDGSKIAFEMDPKGGPSLAIHVMDADGTNITRITDNRGPDMKPDWSPDGSELVYARAGEIFKMNADGTDVTQLTHNRSYDAEPAFSPGGGKLVFVSARDGDRDSTPWTPTAPT